MIDVVELRKPCTALADAFKECGKAWCAMYESMCKCDEAMADYARRSGITPGKNSRWKKVP